MTLQEMNRFLNRAKLLNEELKDAEWECREAPDEVRNNITAAIAPLHNVIKGLERCVKAWEEMEE